MKNRGEVTLRECFDARLKRHALKTVPRQKGNIHQIGEQRPSGLWVGWHLENIRGTKDVDRVHRLLEVALPGALRDRFREEDSGLLVVSCMRPTATTTEIRTSLNPSYVIRELAQVATVEVVEPLPLLGSR